MADSRADLECAAEEDDVLATVVTPDDAVFVTVAGTDEAVETSCGPRSPGSAVLKARCTAVSTMCWRSPAGGCSSWGPAGEYPGNGGSHPWLPTEGCAAGGGSCQPGYHDHWL